MPGACRWPGCKAKGLNWCRTHWWRLPASMRERLRHAFVNQADFVAANEAALEWARKAELRMRGWDYDL